MPPMMCRVSYKHLEGVRHTVDVVAESVYEAAVLALSALSRHEWVENVGPRTRLDVQIIEPHMTHTLMVSQIRAWLDQPEMSAAEATKKRKLGELLAS